MGLTQARFLHKMELTSPSLQQAMAPIPSSFPLTNCTVYPSRPSPVERYDLTPWDLAMLSVHYIQKGVLLGQAPTSLSSVLDGLKVSLADCLAHFVPLAGRLATHTDGSIYIHCNDAGAAFIHAKATHLTVDDIVASPYVTDDVKSFFALDGVIGHDGHKLPLLAVQVSGISVCAFASAILLHAIQHVWTLKFICIGHPLFANNGLLNHEQVTELSDGLFIGCSMNHAVGVGSSFWHFFNSWAEISRGDGNSLKISRPPVLEPWFLRDRHIAMHLSEDTLERYSPPPLPERFFHFSTRSIALLKHKANMHIDEDVSSKISSLQSLTALMWRAVTRAHGLPTTQTTKCGQAVGNRSRLSPPLSPDYFGNSIQGIVASATVGELLSQDLAG
ncbi:hypothetical protein AMTR_s04066p00009030 [Amborella trichopoda]|uniref:Acetyltransferase n=1 Tax=Amborella trichopoda TaxID=13333 RepID=U5CWW1_AMBTC|nr:hypothetical protein AMTR_s04066p00009030 [Amborella trichopoda]